MLLHLGVFVLSNSNRNMNNFLHAIGGFYTNEIYYEDTDSMYIENKHWGKLDEAGLVGKNLLQGKNVYKNGGFLRIVFSTENEILFNHKKIWCYRRTQDFQRVCKCL